MFFFYIIIFFMILDLFTTKKRTKNKLSLILILLLTIFAVLRSVFVGTDMPMYSVDFVAISKMPFIKCLSTRYELLNILLFKLIGYFSVDYQSLVVVSSVLINFGVYIFIIKNQSNPLSATIFYFTLNYYFIFFCLMRQAFALLIVMLGFMYLKDKKIKQYIICVIIASMFHTSAIVFLVLLLLGMIVEKINMKNDAFLIVIVLFLSITGFAFGKQILLIATRIIGVYEKYLSTDYINSSYVTAGLYTLTSLCFLVFGILVPSKKVISEEQEKSSKYDLLKWMLIIGTVISAVSMKIALFSRIYLYFGFFAIFWLSDALELLQKKNNKLLWKIILYFFTFLYVVVVSIYDWYGVFPYEFFWEHKI